MQLCGLESVAQDFFDQPQKAMLDLINLLRSTRNDSCSPESWRDFVANARKTPVYSICQSDPFTWHSFHRPRGYAGDAELLDMIYFMAPSKRAKWSDVGREVFQFTINAQAPAAVRDRRFKMASEIDQAISQDGKAVLSVACGHFRELELVSIDRRAHIVGLDQDPESTRFVRQQFGVEVVPFSVRDFLRESAPLGKFDLVYSSGLYDYFSQPMARRVTQGLFRLVAPGGRLVVANFAPTIRDVGYMECFMDWWLTYRTIDEMYDLASAIPQTEVANLTVTSRCNGDIHYLELQRS